MEKYEDIIKEFNITENNSEEFIGERLKMENFFLKMITLLINDNDLDIEDITYNTDLMLDLVKELSNSGLDYREKIIVKYNPMGAWYYEKYEEE